LSWRGDSASQRRDAENFIQFPKTIKRYLVELGYDDALGLLTSCSQTKNKIYLEGHVCTEEFQEAKATLQREIGTYIATDDRVRVATVTMEVKSPAPYTYRFPKALTVFLLRYSAVYIQGTNISPS